MKRKNIAQVCRFGIASECLSEKRKKKKKEKKKKKKKKKCERNERKPSGAEMAREIFLPQPKF